MYFESSYKCNDNGKISGYHKKGKYEDGKITYFVNDKFGDVKSLPSDEKTSIDNVIPTMPTESGLRKLSDTELIAHCESLSKDNQLKIKHRQLKDKLRIFIHNQLNNEKYVDERLLDDFKFAVAHCEDEISSLTEEDKKRWSKIAIKDFVNYK